MLSPHNCEPKIPFTNGRLGQVAALRQRGQRPWLPRARQGATRLQATPGQSPGFNSRNRAYHALQGRCKDEREKVESYRWNTGSNTEGPGSPQSDFRSWPQPDATLLYPFS